MRSVMATLSAADAADLATARSLFAWHGTHRFCSACGAASQITRAGWQRDCPICGVSHFPRTDPVVIMRIVRGNRLLLGRSPGWPEGMYSLLAGFMEPGETIEAAVRREVAEETAIRVGPVRLIASQPWPYPSSLMIGCEGDAERDEIELLTSRLTADPAAAPVSASAQKGVFLQLGAFSSADNAESLRSHLARELDWLSEAIEINAGGGMHRVHLGPYASRSDAEKVAEKIRLALGYKPSFVVR